MKFKKILFVLLFSLFILPNVVSASSATIKVSAPSTATVGSTVTATITISSSSKIGAWQYKINYDSAKLKLTSGSVSVADYTTSTTGIKSKSYTLKFKALASGNASINVGSYLIYDMDENSMSVTTKSDSVKIITKAELEASYSSNAYLKSLTVSGYDLNPTFNKNTKEYTIEVENDVTSVTIKGSVEDSKSSLSGTGTKELDEGNNEFTIIVTAQKGNELTYKVNVYRKELNPISVTVGDKEYTVVRKVEDLKEYSSFTSTEVDYEDNKIPAIVNDTIGYTLVGLKDESGNINMFIYDNGSIVSQYFEIKTEGLTLLPLDLPETTNFTIYKKSTVTIDDVEFDAYVLNYDAKFAIIYAQNCETGDVKYYTYNYEDNTVQKYESDIEDYFANKITLYKYVIFGCLGFIVFLIFLLFVIKGRRKKVVVYKNVEKVAGPIEVKQIVEESSNKEAFKDSEPETIEEPVIEEPKLEDVKPEEVVEETPVVEEKKETNALDDINKFIEESSKIKNSSTEPVKRGRGRPRKS